MSQQDTQPTSETWTRQTCGMQWFAAYRIDMRAGQFVAVLSRWTDAIADPRQTLLKPQPTRVQAVWAVRQLLVQLGYQMEGGGTVSDILSLQLSLTTLVAYAQQLPADYHISIRLLRHGYTIEVIDPDGTSLVEVATPRLFVELVEIAQADAKRRASE